MFQTSLLALLSGITLLVEVMSRVSEVYDGYYKVKNLPLMLVALLRVASSSGGGI